MTVTEAKILTEETVPAYLAERADEIGVFPRDAALTAKAKAITGGNVNFAFRVTFDDGSQEDRPLFVKQAPEFVAIFGPDGFPLTSDRMQKEIDVYQEWKVILGDELSAKYLPKIYFFDSK